MEIRDVIILCLWLYLANGTSLAIFILTRDSKNMPKQALMKRFSWFYFIPGMCFIIVCITAIAEVSGAIKKKIWEV